MAIAAPPHRPGVALPMAGLALATAAALTSFGSLAVWLVADFVSSDRRLDVIGIGAVVVLAAVAGATAQLLDRRFPVTRTIDLRGAAVTLAVATALLGAGLALVTIVIPRHMPVTRVAGGDRIETAAALSRATFETADAVVVSSATAVADGLAAGPLASAFDGPLLVTGAGRLADDAAREITRLGATTAYLLGGSDVLSQDVVDDLADAGVDDVVRIAGVDRYATAANAAARIGGDHVYVASGTDWPDALAASARAAHDGVALLLLGPGDVPAPTRAALQAMDPREVTVVGGTAAIPATVLSQLRALVPDAEVLRVAGSDRYATARRLLDDTHLSDQRVIVATGAHWSDALAAVPAAAHRDAQLVLLSPDDDDAATNRWLFADRRDIEDVLVVGGDAAIGDGVLDALRER